MKRKTLATISLFLLQYTQDTVHLFPKDTINLKALCEVGFILQVANCILTISTIRPQQPLSTIIFEVVYIRNSICARTYTYFMYAHIGHHHREKVNANYEDYPFHQAS